MASGVQTCMPPQWGETRMRKLWESLYEQDAVSKCQETDTDLQSMSMLLSITFSVFKNTKSRYKDLQQKSSLLSQRLDASNKELIRLESELMKQKQTPCGRCQKLEQELALQKKKIKESDKRMKSIAAILKLGGCADREETQASKAYSLLSEMFEDKRGEINMDDNPTTVQRNNENLNGIQLRNDNSRDNEDEPLEKDQGKKLNALDHLEVDCLQADITLVEELFNDDENPLLEGDFKHSDLNGKNPLGKPKADVMDFKLSKFDPGTSKANNDISGKTIPEVPGNSTAGNIIDVIDLEKEDSDRDFRTPTKGCVEEVEHGSPQLGTSLKKSFSVKNSFSKNDKESGNLDLNCDSSPSLLKDSCVLECEAPKESADKIVGTGIERIDSQEARGKIASSTSQVKEPAIWQLKSDYKLEPLKRTRNDSSGTKKLRQAKLSLSKMPKKQDLSSFDEFAGGVLKTSTVASCGIPEDKDVSDMEQDDLILESPNAAQSNRRSRYSLSTIRKAGESKHSSTRISDETLYITPVSSVAPYVSADKISDSTELNNKDFDIDDLISEMGKASEDKAVGKQTIQSDARNKLQSDKSKQKPLGIEAITHSRTSAAVLESSFDRLPEKVSDSPKYVYKRDAVRGKKARSKLQGVTCDECKDLYDDLPLTDEERANIINACSRHRNTHPISRNKTPPGFWDLNMSLDK